MLPSMQLCSARIRACLLDLSTNGIHLADADEDHQARIVREHLDYFQLMLGFDSDPLEVLRLLRERGGE